MMMTMKTLINSLNCLFLSKISHEMNRLEYYNRQKDSWDENEIQSLKSEYEKEKDSLKFY